MRRADGRAVEVIEAAEQRSHRLDHRGERDAGLDVETVPRRHGEPELARSTLQVEHQRGLADPGVAPDEHGLRGALCGEREGLVQLGGVPLATQEKRSPGRYGHVIHRLGVGRANT